MPINREWHAQHPMPRCPTLEQRVAWHAEHARHCACREMPPKITAILKQRAATKTPDASRRKATATVEIPGDLQEALSRNKAAQAVFDGLPPSHRREYVNYIEEAKKPETRARRIEKTIAMLTKEKMLAHPENGRQT